MHIQRPYKSRTLTTIIVQSQQLETSIILCTQVALNLVFITKCLQLSTGHQEFLCHLLHAVVAQHITENLKVARLIDTRILRNLLEIREGTPLSLLVGNDGRVVGCSALIVARILYATEVVVIARRGLPVPVQPTGATLYVILRTTIPSPAATYRGAAIHLGRVVLMHLFHPVVTIGYPVAGRFIASSHHHERGVMTVLIDDTLRLLQQVLVNRLTTAQFDTMIRPRRTFRLQVDTHTVCCRKSRLGRTVAMKAHVVETILLAFLEDTHPLVLIGWGKTRLRETAVLHGAT